jgi:hypothetical protein
MTGRLRRIAGFGLLCVGTVLSTHTAVAQQAARSLVIGATVANTTSLRLSSSTLHIEVVTGGSAVVVGTIAFHAGARTRTAGEVILTVEALRDPETLASGPSGDSVVVEYGGSADGVVPGVLSTGPQVAGRWTGSGARHGQLVFTLRSAGALAGGTIPLRFVLVTP